MTVHQYLSDNLQPLITLTKNQIVDAKAAIRDFIITDKFQKLTGSKKERYKSLAEEYRMHPNSIQRIVLKFSKEI